MKIDLQPVAFKDKSVLQRLMEFYNYDFSEFEGTDVDEHGVFGYHWLDHYWTEPGRRAFFITVDGKHAGFVFVRTLPNGARAIPEFFVMRRYRRANVGTEAAREVIGAMKGRWEIAVLAVNTAARAFWESVLAPFDVTVVTEGDGKTLVHQFSNEGVS